MLGRPGDGLLVLEAVTYRVLTAMLSGSPHQVSIHWVWKEFSPFQ